MGMKISAFSRVSSVFYSCVDGFQRAAAEWKRKLLYTRIAGRTPMSLTCYIHFEIGLLMYKLRVKREEIKRKKLSPVLFDEAKTKYVTDLQMSR